VLSLAVVVIGMDNLILNLALPTLVRELQATASELQWMVDACVVVFAGLLLTMGAVGDRFGRKRLLTLGATWPEGAQGTLGSVLSRAHACGVICLTRCHNERARGVLSRPPRNGGDTMTGNTEVVVIGGGYAGVLAANRLTQRDDVTVTLANPRLTFVERLRLHQLVGSHEAVVDALGPDSVADVVAKAEPNPPADAEDGMAALRHLEDRVTP
jgi:MFS family permease